MIGQRRRRGAATVDHAEHFLGLFALHKDDADPAAWFVEPGDSNLLPNRRDLGYTLRHNGNAAAVNACAC
jgi:hypothetical protein